jgi:hypothetical protein
LPTRPNPTPTRARGPGRVVLSLHVAQSVAVDIRISASKAIEKHMTNYNIINIMNFYLFEGPQDML